jgi:hypothetical protein
MTDQPTEIFSSNFRNTRAGGPKTNEAYLASWVAYQRGALTADEFMRSLERDLRLNLEELEARPGSSQVGERSWATLWAHSYRGD